MKEGTIPIWGTKGLSTRPRCITLITQLNTINPCTVRPTAQDTVDISKHSKIPTSCQCSSRFGIVQFLDFVRSTSFDFCFKYATMNKVQVLNVSKCDTLSSQSCRIVFVGLLLSLAF
jgi:hypothetical protein